MLSNINLKKFRGRETLLFNFKSNLHYKPDPPLPMPAKSAFKRFKRTCLYTLKNASKKVLVVFMRAFGINLLSQEQTISFLKPYLVNVRPKTHLILPAVTHITDNGKTVFTQHEAI